MCNRCNVTIENDLGGSKSKLMLRHIANISSYVKYKHKKTVLMWHDMLTNVEPNLIREFSLGKLVEPVVWAYYEKLNATRMKKIWKAFGGTFPYVWGASAFKGIVYSCLHFWIAQPKYAGASGPAFIHSNVSRYLNNHKSWLSQMINNHAKFKEFRGLILTGWQR